MDGNIAKRIKTENSLNGVNIYFVKEGINRRRLKVMENCAETHGFVVNQSFSDRVDYVISDVTYEEQVERIIGVDLTAIDSKAIIVNTKWFTDCVQSKQLLPFNKNHRLKNKRIQTSIQSSNEEKYANYICQRKAPLKHLNQKLTEALELLALEAELRDTLFDEVRYLAFKKASAALKCLPFPVTNIDEVSNIRDIGQHSKKVIQEILDEGISSEVKKIENSVWFKTMRLFTNVYGIGPKTAKQWYDIGLRSIEEVINSDNAIKIQHKRVIHGLAFYDDLNEPMTRLEANRILAIVRKEIKSKFPLDHMKIEIFLTGGFGRGKEVGHDLDILITHKDEGSDRGLLSQLYAHFKAMNFILLGNFGTNNNDCETDEKRKNSTLDNFDKVFTIFKLPINENECDLSTPDFDARNTRALFEFAQSHRKTKWKARRVDLIVCPYSQLPFAMIGWIGNEMFNRSLREYAKKEMNMKLTNHCLRDLTKGCDLVARNELEVFELLKLPFIEHSLRNP